MGVDGIACDITLDGGLHQTVVGNGLAGYSQQVGEQAKFSQGQVNPLAFPGGLHGVVVKTQVANSLGAAIAFWRRANFL